MTKDEVLQIINQEKLINYNFFENRQADYNEIGISQNNDKWEVYFSDERGYKETVTTFDSETEALSAFLDDLRTLQSYLKSPYR